MFVFLSQISRDTGKHDDWCFKILRLEFFWQYEWEIVAFILVSCSVETLQVRFDVFVKSARDYGGAVVHS